MDSQESDASVKGGLGSWNGPHSVVIARSETGFGFTLRHFVVHPPPSVLDDSKSDFEYENQDGSQDIRLEPQDTIFVKTVAAGGPAHSAGLNTGDRIVAVNGDSVTGKSYSQVITLIQASLNVLKLLVVPKDEDILQMAYQSEVGEPVYVGNASLQDTTTYNQQQTHSNAYDLHSCLEQNHSPCDQGLTHQLTRYSGNGTRTSPPHPKLHHQPKLASNQESPAKMSIASNIPSKTKYSFGLYFPPKATTTAPNTAGSNVSSSSSNTSNNNKIGVGNSRTTSTESLGYSRGVDSSAMSGSNALDSGMQGRHDPKHRKSSLDETPPMSSSARSRDYFIRYSADKSNSDARNRYGLRHSTHERSSLDKPTYVITRSQTVSAISPTQSPVAGPSSSYSRRSGDFSKMSRRYASDDIDGKTERPRQVTHQMSTASSESKLLSDGRNVQGIQISSYSTREGGVTSKSTSSVPTASTKTFVVRIPCDQQQPSTGSGSQGRESKSQVPSRQSYGTAFALKKSNTATHIQIQKAIGKPIVSQRKSQFESKKAEEPLQPSKKVHQGNRYKMEIERIRTQPKFSSIALRKASFENSPDRDVDEDDREMDTSGSDQADNQSPKPVIKIRKIGPEKYDTVSPSPQQSGFRERSATAPSPTRPQADARTESSSPIHIYMAGNKYSQFSSSSSPLVVSVMPNTDSGLNTSSGSSLKPSSSGDGSRNNLLSSPVQDESCQRFHSSPSPSSLSTGTMGDSGVWVKSYHGSCDMLDSNLGGPGGSTTVSSPSSVLEAPTMVYPRHRHKSYMEAVNSPTEIVLPSGVQQQQAFRGVHTQSPQQMLAQSQALPHVPSMHLSAMPSSSQQASIYPVPPSQKSVGVNAYSQALPSPSQAKTYHHPPHHQHLFSGSSSTHSLSSIGSETAQYSSGDHTVMTTSDSAVSVCGTGPPGRSANVTSKPGLSVTMRKKSHESLEDQASKLHRRTSYLMATAKDRANTVPIEEAFSPQQRSGDKQQSSPQQSGPVRKQSSVKLGKFFGEHIPSIDEGVESKSIDDDEATPPPTPPPEIIRKGHLSCKIAVMEGKKCSDRTWKPVYAILRQTEMYLSKDPHSSASSFFENQLIPLKSCMVEFARDYAKKKKNVFRLTTHQECEYLFQAEDRGTMLCWIQAIKSINEPEKAEKMDEMIAVEQAKHVPAPVEINVVPSSKLSPPLGHMAKKFSGLSLRSKLTSSPNMRRKKSNASEKDKLEDGVKKSWKGRIPMMKNLKKHSEDSLAPPSLDLDPGADCCRQFGMPMEDCFPSPYNEYVPLIVELCTRIVETRGLEVVGVYRVPGNSAAVNALVEEFNRGIDNVNIDNEKLLDINVISSLLKSFFRKLPEPLVNAESYDGFIEANRNPDVDKRMLKLKRLLHLLPTHHNETFKHMAQHLNKVASYGNINKMDAKNLAIMFGPTLIRKSEDDTVSLVTDMSDQCRIIESIILHCDWFFSQWDQDSHIPMDTKVETVPDVPLGGKDDDEEADSAISTKELISSIVGAASRKLRDQQQKSEDSLDSACGMYSSSLSQDGRSFYQERKAEESLRLSSMSTSKSHASISSSHSGDIVLGHTRNGSNQNVVQDFLPPHVTSSEPDFLELEFADASSPTTSALPRHFSDESILEKNDELEISHGLGTSMSRQTIHNTLMRIGNDVKTLLQTFEQKQMLEMERRRKEQEMIEHEHLRTQLELEQEDNHSVDDWLAVRGAGAISSCHMPDLVSSSYMGDTYPYSHCGFDSILPDGDRQEIMEREKMTLLRPSSALHSQSPVHHSYQGSLDSAISKTSCDSSFDDLLNSSGSHHPHQESPRYASPRNHPQKKGHPAGKQKNIHLAVEKQHLRPSSFRLSVGRRHGSLDSLIDLIDKRSSWASTDSEDGSDLLTSLTTTFDQKLQILVNPKYRLTGNGGRKHYGNELKPATIVSDMFETALRRSRQNLVSPSTVTSHQSSLPDTDRPFRDPSLHRHSKPEAKIGIASRFERNDNRALLSSPVMNTSEASFQGQRSPRKAPLPDYGAFLNRQNTHSSKDGVYISLTKPKKMEDNPVFVLRSSNRSSRSITKSEKTERNSNLARLSKEEKALIQGGEESDRQENKENKRKRRSERKMGQRRHTVGGTQDYEHIDALLQMCGSGEEDSGENGKMSAWDQLQPVVKDGGDRSLQSWLQKERIRGSTPDLSIGD